MHFPTAGWLAIHSGYSILVRFQNSPGHSLNCRVVCAVVQRLLPPALAIARTVTCTGLQGRNSRLHEFTTGLPGFESRLLATTQGPRQSTLKGLANAYLFVCPLPAPILLSIRGDKEGTCPASRSASASLTRVFPYRHVEMVAAMVLRLSNPRGSWLIDSENPSPLAHRHEIDKVGQSKVARCPLVHSRSVKHHSQGRCRIP